MSLPRMDELTTPTPSNISMRAGKSFSKIDNLSKDDSITMGRITWRRHYRSQAENIGLVTRLHSASGVGSIDSGHDSDSWSEDDSVIDDLRYQCMWQKGGKFLFQSKASFEYTQEYILLDSESTVEDAVSYMSRKWRLPMPKIVVSIISNVDYFLEPSDSMIDDLTLGLLQSARLTKMWILTDGLNYGAAHVIGDAIAQEKMRRRFSFIDASSEDNGISHITAIGVVSTDQLRYGKMIEEETGFRAAEKTLTLENEGDERQELNPLHSHFLIMSSSDLADKEANQNFRFNLEAKLAHLLYVPRKESKPGEVSMLSSQEEPRENMKTPVVALMIQGGPGEIERVLWLLKKNIPVIILVRKGYATGLLALAYQECLQGDTTRIEQILKPQLMSKVKEAFPDYCSDNELLKQQVRDKILECARVATQSENRLIFLLDPSSPHDDLKDLNKYILAAVLSVQRGRQEEITREATNKALLLALRWNRVDFVTKTILNQNYIPRFRVRDDLFVEALLLQDREAFVELFLNMGFLLQRLMTYEQVLRLFEASLSEEFFVTICLQNILTKKTAEIGTKFMHESNCELNKLLCALSGLGNLVDPSHLLISHTANRVASNVLEKRALLTILYWAVLTNRKELVKVLWKRSAEPIAVALVISNMYYRMSKYWIKDVDLKDEIKQNAIEFGQLAIKMMDFTFNDSRLLAFHSLTKPIHEFNNLNVVDLALIGHNIFFIAHPCCQRSMRERWFGYIKIKSYGIAFIGIPEFIKIYLCLILVFPMYFWISFKPLRRRQQMAFEDDDERDKNINNAGRDSYGPEFIPRRVPKTEPFRTPNIFMKVYYLWTAPITKFWVNQLFVLAYLFLYATAVMLPYCGDIYVNWVLCLWTMVLIFESVFRTAQMIKKFPTMNLTWPLIRFLAETSTVGVLLLHLQGGILNFMTYKLLMALSMLAIYFGALRDMLTASPELGPMLVNITELTHKDMINWIGLWMMCLISGGLAIHAVIYPAQPFTVDTLGRALLRATLGIWLTDISDLEGDSTCSALYDTQEISHTCNSSTISAFALSRLENCPNSSMAGYFMVMQYIMITRLVFYTLMFAMFSATISRTQTRSVELWKYQFQSIVSEFETRPVIPAPLNIITYPFRLSYFLGNVALEILLECSTCCREVPTRKDQMTVMPYNQWKSYLARISREEDEKEDKLVDVMTNLEDDSAVQEVAIKQLTDHLVYIERHQTMTAVYLEELKKKLETLEPKVRAHTQHRSAQEIHGLSRQSPYPGTDIERFLLLDKDVPWEITFEAYDPATYTKPMEEFPLEEQPLIDIDILSLPMIGGQYQTTLTLENDSFIGESGPRTQQIDILYNATQTLTLPSGPDVTLDRRSYMMYNDQPLQYNVDATGVPINPMGRTGLRGRGLLPRWGPNHWIKAVISRFKVVAVGQPSTANAVDVTKPRLEILVKSSADGASLSLIGAPTTPSKTPYSTLCDLLLNIFPDDDLDHGPNADQEEMIHTFSKFASYTYGKKSKAGYATYGYSAFLVYRGYEDSPVNTDNAWREVEIFNFHYKHRDGFDTRLKADDSVGWQTVSDKMPLSPTDMAAVREADKIRTRTV